MIPRWFQALCWIALAISAAVFAWLGFHHVAYLGFLEQMEADTLQQIARIARGEPAYPKPDGEFIALAYTPLYYFVSAPFYRLFGDGFAGPRLVSFLAAMLSGLLIFRFARRESGQPALGALAAAFYFAGFRIMDCWLTCALPDALFLLLLLAGFWHLAYATRVRHEVAWLVCFTLAFWTKQHGAFYFGLAVVYALFLRKNLLPKWTYVAGLLLGGPALYFGLAPWMGEGFVEQTLVVPGHWGRSPLLAVRRTAFVLIEFVPYLTLLGVIYGRAALRCRPLAATGPAWMVISALLSTIVTMSVAGSSNNHYIPLIASLCVVGALGVDQVLRGVSTRSAAVPILIGMAAVLLFSATMTWMSLRQPDVHPVPAFVPDVAAVALFAVFAIVIAKGLWAAPTLTPGSATTASLATPDTTRHNNAGALAVVVAILAAAQLACEHFPLAPQLAHPAFASDLRKLQREMRALEEPVAWLPYGHVPKRLASENMISAPSTIALEDMARQDGVEGDVSVKLAPFYRRIESLDGLYALTDVPIENLVVWNELPVEWRLVRDYGDDFSGVQQITRHWFGGGTYPRYLYRMRCLPSVRGPAFITRRSPRLAD